MEEKKKIEMLILFSKRDNSVWVCIIETGAKNVVNFVGMTALVTGTERRREAWNLPRSESSVDLPSR